MILPFLQSVQPAPSFPVSAKHCRRYGNPPFSLGASSHEAIQIVFSHIAYIFVQIENTGRSQPDSAYVVNHYTLYFVYIAIAAFVTHYVSTAGFIYAGEKLTRRIKEHYMEAVLKQNMAIFDEQGAGDMITQLTSDMNLIQEGISQKVALTLKAFGVLASTFVLSFILNWKLTFILTWSIFFAIMLLVGGKKIAIRYSRQSLKAYSSGGAVAEEAFGSIKNTTALGMQRDIVERYSHYLNLARSSGFRLKSFMGCMTGFAIATGYINVALAFWQGSRFLVDGNTSFTDVVTITIATKSAAFAVLGVGAHIGAFTSAMASAARIFSMIGRKSPIDPTSDDGHTLDEVTGAIEFRNVKHIYPSRPKVVVAENLNITFPPGKTTAVVGASGSGKSTIIHLIERFYDPVNGAVLLDGQDIQSLNLRWLRRQIRLISQEPMLFDTTISQNIEQGLIGAQYEKMSSEEKQHIVEEAAKWANAHDFIVHLPQGYQTCVGPRGSRLSGGQKQRVAIARAIASRPKILILDEATSALDSETEAKLQAALNSDAAGRAGRTTIIVAHRLSTIRDADNIIVLEGGRVAEQGAHLDLLNLRGAYHRLVEAQAQGLALGKTDTDSLNGPKEMEEKWPQKTFSADKGPHTKLSEKSETLDTLPTTITDKEDVNSRYSLLSLIRFVAGLNRKELHIILIGLVCSIITGCEEPVYAILFGKSVVAISLPLDESNHIRSRAGFWSLMLFILALVEGIVFCAQGIAFAYCSEHLIHRARYRALHSILHQNVAFFDKKENSAGALTSFLSTEATQVASISGATLGTILLALATLVAAFIVGMIYGWKLALVCSSVIPVLVGCGFMGVWFNGEFQHLIHKYNQVSATYASEAVSAIQTIASMTRESDVLEYFRESLMVLGRESLMSNLKASFVYALAQSLLYACMALGFWYGGTLVLRLEYSLLQFTIVFTAVIMGAFSAGLIFQFAPDISKAKHSAYNLKRLLEQKSKIDPRDPRGLDPGRYQGKIEFRHVYFKYPARPQHLVLDDISFTVQPGQHIALVGETGCGKSTIVSLLERFYDSTSGDILVDGMAISSLNISKYRRSLGLVIQEPTLYDGTIRANLLAGLDGEHVSDSAIEVACKDANIFEFITTLP